MSALPPSSAPARLFLALWPQPPVRDALVQYRDAWRWNIEAVPVPARNLHLTLHFIGNVERQRLPEFQAQLDVAFDAFELRFGRAEQWHRGIAVVRPLDIPAGLAELHGALHERLLALGVSLEERKYHPHVTLARRAATAEPPAPTPPISWHVAQYMLMESRPGADYRVLQTYSTPNR